MAKQQLKVNDFGFFQNLQSVKGELFWKINTIMFCKKGEEFWTFFKTILCYYCRIGERFWSHIRQKLYLR